MKLHLLIDCNISVEGQAEDIALVSSYRDKMPTGCRTAYLDVNIVNEAPEIGEVIRLQLGEFDAYYMNIANEAYIKFYRPIFMVIANVEKQLGENSIDELVLYEGCETPYFITEGAEGEGVRDHYITNWMVNAFIYSQYKDKLRITWNKKNRAILLRFKNYYRNFLNTAKMIVSQGLRGIFECRKSTDIETSGITLVSVITLALQKANLDTTLKGVNKAHHVYYSYNRELVNEDNVNPVIELSLCGLYKSIRFVRRLKQPRAIKLMDLPVPALERELKYLVQKYAIYEERLRQTIMNVTWSDKTVMVTNTTVGMDMMVCRNIARQVGWRHINLQYVSMGRVLYPNLDLADEYYLYARRTYDLYKYYSDNFRLYLPLTKGRQKRGNLNKTIVFSIFTQPDSFGKEYVDYLRLVLPEIMKSNKDIKVIVKPHYRQDNVDELREVTEKYDFAKLAEPKDSCSDILSRTTIAMSINSSVIFEAMMAGVPTVVYNPEDKYHSTVYNNDFCYPEVNFVIEDAQQTLPILRKIDNYRELFDSRLTHFIENSCAETEINKIIKL